MSKFELEYPEPFQPKFKKPGPHKKKTRKTERAKIREIEKPKSLECKWCNVETGTECYRHAEDPEIKFLVGGGIVGGKNPDQLSSWGCDDCDREMSTKPHQHPQETWYEFKIRFLEWQNKWKLGVIKSWLL